MKKRLILDRVAARTKKYEEQHPFMPFIMGMCVIFILTIIIFGIFRIKVYQHNNIIQRVEFKDKNFENALCQYLKKDILTEADLKRMVSLKIEDDFKIENIEDIKKCENLEAVEIVGCRITDIGILGELDKLKDVNVSSNRISSLEGIGKSATIKKLNVRNNKISDISELCKVSTLTELNVSYNNLGSLPENLKDLGNLSIFNCSGNRLISIEQVSGLERLQELFANDNKMIVSPTLEDVPLLYKVVLSNNAFQNIDTIGTLEELEELDVSDNYLSNFKFVIHYPKLKVLNISNNQYTSLDGLENCVELEKLDIRGTSITDVSILKQFPKFNSIYVNDDFDRSQLDFMIENFRSADTITKQYFLDKQYLMKRDGK